MHVDVSGDLAIVRTYVHMSGDSIHDDYVDHWFRATIELKKIEGRWLITHEHNSVPLDETTMKGLMTLVPDEEFEIYRH